MKKLLIAAGILLTLTGAGYAWVAARGGGACYHAGYSCGGVYTGTAAAHGYTGYAAGTVVHPTTVAAPVYVAPAYGYGYSYAVTTTPPPPVPQVNVPSPGTIVHTLPPGAQMQMINGIRYYVAGSVYYQAFFGNNGVYYVVQAGPM